MSRFAKVMIALLAVAVFATPALADYKFSLYGQARVATFYSDWDNDVETFDIVNQGNSRIGFRASKGPVSGHFEMAVASNAISTRLMYGSYKFNGGAFSFGQDHGAFGTQFMSNQVFGADLGNIGYGSLYEGRRAMARVILDNGFGIWLRTSNDAAKNTDGASLPAVAVTYNGKVEGFSYSAAAAYQQNEVVDDSYMVGFTGTVNLNPAAIKFILGYGQNVREYGIANNADVLGNHIAATAAEEATYIGAVLQGSFKINNSNLLSAGVGYVQEERDDLNQTEKRYNVFVNNAMTIAPGFVITPEVSYYEVLDHRSGSSAAELKQYHVGAKWQINF